jgi:hypothetical protein
VLGNTDTVGIVEPNGKLLDQSLTIASSLNKPKQGHIGIRMMNLSAKDVQLYHGMHIGVFSPVEAIGPELASTDEKSCNEDCYRIATATSQEITVPEHLKALFERSAIELPAAETARLATVLQEYEDIFMKPEEPLPGTNMTSHHIETGNAAPVRQAPCRIPIHQKPIVEEELQKMLKDGIVEPAEGPWASPIVLVKKKDGSTRFCIDYRKLNDLTRKDAYPIPRIDDTLDMLSGAKYFSTLDLASGYWQVPVAEEDKEKTAFSTHIGLFQFNRMPFGLCNAPSTFERLMEQVLKGLQWQVCLLYLDDIIIFSHNLNDHFQRLTTVFQRIREANLRMKSKKCHLFQLEVDYLGHVVSQAGVSTAEDKVNK